MERIDTWILLFMALWLGACIIVNAVIQRNRKAKKLRKQNKELRLELEQVKTEFSTLNKSIGFKERHSNLIRDMEIDNLKGELAAWEKKYRILEDAMNRMWPKGDAADGQ